MHEFILSKTGFRHGHEPVLQMLEKIKNYWLESNKARFKIKVDTAVTNKTSLG